VQTVPGHINIADVMFAAEVEHRAFGIRRYRANLAPSSSMITLTT
jgi:hypothetical protein